MRNVIRAVVSRSPLRRTVDRVEIAAGVVAFVLTALAVPLAVFAGGAVHRHDLATAARSAGDRAIVVAAGFLVTELLLLGALAYAAKRRFDAIRSAAWEREWQLIEPLWTDRLPEV
jgi:hypothetical protein